MNKVFNISRSVDFNIADKTPKRTNDQSHFQILTKLTEQKLFPEIYLELLNGLDSALDVSELSKKFLKIYLYASTKIKDPGKLYKWLLKGTLPQTISQGGDTMAQLAQYTKKINKLRQNRDKEIDKITKTREKISKKTSKKLEDSISKGTEKIGLIEEQFGTQREMIEDIILEIETSLGSGRKL